MSNLLLMATLIKNGTGIEAPRVMIPPVDVRDVGEAAAALCLVDNDSYHGKFVEVRGM